MRIAFGLLLVALCGCQRPTLQDAAMKALGPPPPGTRLVVTKDKNSPPVAVEGAHVIKSGQLAGMPGVFQRWEIPGKPPEGLFAKQ